MAPRGGARVAIYARISLDLTGEAAGVRRQLEDGRDLATRHGFAVVAELSDNDISALKGAHRPGYQELLNLVGAGAIDYVVCWQMSRLWRNRRERATAIELFSTKAVGILAVRGADLDLSTAYGRAMAGLLGEFDTMESEVKSERVTAAAAQRAHDGRPSSYLGYGWIVTGKGRQSTWVEHLEQAEIVREITRRLLAGDSLKAVTADLTVRGVPGPIVADHWGTSSVKKIAIRPSNAGLRLHHRGRPTETLYPGTWPALVERADWERVRALLTDPSRNIHGNLLRPGARKHLLTFGIGECGVCGSVLRAGPRGQKGHRKPRYVCDRNECVGRDQAKVDEMVGEVVCAWISQPHSLDYWAADDDQARQAQERVEELQARLDQVDEDRYVNGRLDARRHERIANQLRHQLEAAERERRRHLVVADVELAEELAHAGEDALRVWGGWGVGKQRALLQSAGFRVIVDPTKRGPGFRREHVRISNAAG